MRACPAVALAKAGRSIVVVYLLWGRVMRRAVMERYHACFATASGRGPAHCREEQEMRLYGILHIHIAKCNFQEVLHWFV